MSSLGNQCLAAVGHCSEPGTPVDCDSPVVKGGFFVSHPGVNSNSHADGKPSRPRLVTERPLDESGCGHRIAGSGEHGEEAVSLAAFFEHNPTVFFDARGEELVVTPDGELHGPGVVLPPSRGRFDVRQEESNRPLRQARDPAFLVDRGAHGPFSIRPSSAAVEESLPG